MTSKKQYEIRAPYTYDAKEASARAAVACPGESAVQSAKDECDINVIVKRFGVTGQLPQSVRMPTYADFDDVWDFQSAMHAIQAAEKSFMALAPEIRARFFNDPAQFVDFCSDPANLEACREMGLAEPAPAVPPEGQAKGSEPTPGKAQ